MSQDKPQAGPPAAKAPESGAAGARGSPLEQVGYLGLAHFLRAQGHVGQAAQIIADARGRPDVAAVGAAMARFAKVTPKAQGPALVDYFLALTERKLQLRGVSVDPLVMYMLHGQLAKIAP